MMNDIQRWLQKPDNFQVGVALYEKYGKNSVLKILFQGGAHTLSWVKLKEALTELANQVSPPAPSQPPRRLVERRLKPSQLKDAPPIVRGWVESRTQHYDEMRVLHSQLRYYPTNDERYQAALRIVELESLIWDLWEKTKYYDEHLKLPPIPPIVNLDITDRASLQKRLTNLRSYISKHSGKVEREADVLAWETERKRVEERLADLPETNQAPQLPTPARTGAGTCIILAGNLNTGKSFYYEELQRRHPSFELIQIDRFLTEADSDDSVQHQLTFARLQLIKHLIAAPHAIYATTTANEIHTYAMEVIKNKFDQVLTVKIECPYPVAYDRYQAMPAAEKTIKNFDLSWQHCEQTLSRLTPDLTLDSTQLSKAQVDLILSHL